MRTVQKKNGDRQQLAEHIEFEVFVIKSSAGCFYISSKESDNWESL